jgi:lipoprotein-anchoring transpeptidase ErfK/SrfK
MRRIPVFLLLLLLLALNSAEAVEANDFLTRTDNAPAPQMRPTMAVPVNLGYAGPPEFPTKTEKWIDVDLTEQRVVAYEGTRPVRAFIISSGLPGTPTVTGTFRIWVRTPVQTMSGGSRAGGDFYSLPNVQWVQYFYGDYALHGAYWHNNWGQPMSRGCINMRNEDAEWLYKWAMPEWDGEQGWLYPTEENATIVVVRK